MTKHSGRRAAKPARRVPRRQFLILAGGMTATLVMWGVLVFSAIEAGRSARAGSVGGWTLLAVATLVAAACLFLTLILGAKAVEVLLQRPAPVPIEAPAGTAAESAPPSPAAPSPAAPSPAAAPRAPGRRRATR